MSGRLLFTWKDGLEVLDLGTSKLTQLVPAPSGARVASARWSPSGSQIAYAVSPQQVGSATVSAIIVASSDGSSARPVASSDGTNVFYQWPVWGPDGSHLFALRAEPNSARIERISLATAERQTVLDRVADYDVSRDGRIIVFVRNADAGASLNLARIDGGGEPSVLVSPQPLRVVAAPRFTHDGRSILFSLSRPPAPESSRPDSSRLAILIGVPTAHAHGFPQDIYSVPIEGGPMQLMIRLGVDDPVGTWSPDSTRLAGLTPDSLGLATPGGTFTPILAPGGLGSVDWAP
ncbi:MAG: hypothetical protein HW416_552 [Chloroflexi bacterium]|nr:hypothetical protein [Chloroflexota bacterium]